MSLMKTDHGRTLITGGSAGIGLATARMLLENGHCVFICGRSKDKLDVALDDLQGSFGTDRISGEQCDVGHYEAVCGMIGKAAAFLGGIDTLVNNAGIGTIASIDEMSVTEWQTMISTNLNGVFYCSKAALPELRKSGKANIINLGSRAGRYSFAGGTAYNATKFGLQGFSEALFLDLNKEGIGVSLVAPGTVATDLTDAIAEDWHLLPEDIAKVILNLLANNKRANVNWIEIRPGMPR